MTVWVQFKFLIPKCAHDVNIDSGVFNYVPKVNLNIPSYITHPNWGDIYKKIKKKLQKLNGLSDKINFTSSVIKTADININLIN